MRPCLWGYEAANVDALAMLKWRDPTLRLDVASPGRRRALRYLRAYTPVRPPGAVSLGPFVKGTAPPFPERRSPLNSRQGLIMRLGQQLPIPHQPSLRRLARYTRSFLIDRGGRASVSSLPSLEEWLSQTHYPESRKEELRRVYSERCARHPRAAGFYGLVSRELARRHLPVISASDTVCEAFVKSEWYPSLKQPRIISARKDVLKVLFGPLVKAMEKIVYHWTDPSTQMPYFIKHVPVRNRPACLMALQPVAGVGTVLGSDYTAFESCIKPGLYGATQRQLYNWLCGLPWNATLRNTEWRTLSDPQFVCLLLQYICTSRNRLDLGWFVGEIEGCRMSGEMDTSLGNGFVNLMMCSLACQLSGSRCRGFVEGDDGIFCVDGPPPSPSFFACFGASIKMERFGDIARASFCGNVFHREVQTNLTDPRWFACRVAWCYDGGAVSANSNVRRELLRARAMSALAEYAGCPVVAEYARYLLRVTGPGKARWSVSGSVPYWDDQVLEPYLSDLTQKVREWALIPTDMRSRLVVQDVFGMSVDDQLRAEAALRRHESLDPIDLGIDMPPVWKDFHRMACNPWPCAQ